MMQQVLPVESELDIEDVRRRWQTGEPPASAEEYLLRVRLEFQDLPSVVEATHIDARQYDANQTRYMPSQPDLPECDQSVLPSEEWERSTLSSFVDLRLTLARYEAVHGGPSQRRFTVPALREEGRWKSFFFGRHGGSSMMDAPPPPQASASQPYSAANGGAGDLLPPHVTTSGSNGAGALGDAAYGSSRNNGVGIAAVKEGAMPPSVGLILQFDQVCTMRLLGYHASWLETASELEPPQALWLFALLARLDKPLLPDACALVRQIYRRCWVLRSRIEPQAPGSSSVGREEEGVLSRLNTILAITGVFFEQAESGQVSDAARREYQRHHRPTVTPPSEQQPRGPVPIFEAGDMLEDDIDDDDMMDEDQGYTEPEGLVHGGGGGVGREAGEGMDVGVGAAAPAHAAEEEEGEIVE